MISLVVKIKLRDGGSFFFNVFSLLIIINRGDKYLLVFGFVYRYINNIHVGIKVVKT